MSKLAEQPKVGQDNLKKVFIDYFELLDNYFSGIKHHLGESEDSHIRLGEEIANHPLIADLILDAIDDIDEAIIKFWENRYEIIKQHTQLHDGLKCLYSGDLSPLYLDRFVKKAELYVDTIILPDPLSKLSVALKPQVSDRRFYLNKLVRHIFNVWKLKDLFFASTQYQIIILSPLAIQLIDDTKASELVGAADQQFVKYFNELFDGKFCHPLEILSFCAQLANVEALFKEVKRYDLMPSEIKSPDTFKTKMEGMVTINKKFRSRIAPTIPLAFAHYVRAQFIRVKEHTYFCDVLSAEPIYDHDLPWFFLNYELGGQDIDPAIMNTLQKENFEWIGNIPISAISKLREEGELEYVRSELRKSIYSLKTKKDRELTAITSQLQENFREIAAKQKSDITGLQKKVSEIVKKEIPIAGVGFLVGFIPYLGGFLSLLPTVKEFFSKLRTTKKELKKEETSAINLLLQTHERTKE